MVHNISGDKASTIVRTAVHLHGCADIVEVSPEGCPRESRRRRSVRRRRCRTVEWLWCLGSLHSSLEATLD